jgi:anti-anti-sigma regulatory factor
MTKKKNDAIQHAVTGRFDSKAAWPILERLETAPSDAATELVLDFSGVNRVTADGITSFRTLVDQAQARGKKLVITGMRSEAYKALKIAGVTDSLVFTHRSISPQS